jgi:hypothetical protein
MSQLRSRIGDIAYNPASGAFEALVTIDTPDGPHRVAAGMRAPLDADPHAIADGLLLCALRRFGRPDAMQSFRRAPAGMGAAALPRAA